VRTALIHPTAIIHSDARLAPDVEVGPWTIIGADVEIGSGTVIESHVVIKGPTRIGAHNHIFQFSTIGEATPDLKYKGEPTRLVIGDHNIIREGVTIHRGTVQDRSETTIGDHNLLMAYVHIGHDSVVGNHCILVNNTALAGHVHIGDWAILSGFTLAEAKSINAEGLRRRGFDRSEVASIQKAFKLLYRRGLTLGEALAELEPMVADCRALEVMVDSIRSSSRGIVR